MKNHFPYPPKVLIILILLTPFFCPVFGQPDEHDHQDGDTLHLTHDQLKIGERLFYGLLPLGENALSCASCHNTNVIDSLNWNPSAMDIALSSRHMIAERFSAMILNPTGKKLSEVHHAYDLSADQLILIKAFLSEFSHEGLSPEKKVVTKRFLFIFALILIFASVTGIAIYQKKLYRAAFTLLMILSLLYVIKEMVHESIAVGRSPGYAPDQPIKFSHLIHSGQNQIDCLYCHSSARYSKSATIPAVGVCLNCHQYVVREGRNSGTFEIRKILDHASRGEPVVWNRVYSLQDHVFFSHAQHVSVGNIECATCHGEVPGMHIIKQFNDLSMGWCVNCHRESEVQFDGSEFYEKYEKLHEDLKSGKSEWVSVSDIGGIECMKCHY